MSGQDLLDAHALLANLSITDVSAVQPINGGSDTAIWHVIWNGQPYALRVGGRTTCRCFMRGRAQP